MDTNNLNDSFIGDYEFHRSGNNEVELQVKEKFVNGHFIPSTTIRIKLPKQKNLDIKKYEGVIADIFKQAQGNLDEAKKIVLVSNPSKTKWQLEPNHQMNAALKDLSEVTQKTGVLPILNYRTSPRIIELKLEEKKGSTSKAPSVPSVPYSNPQNKCYSDSFTQIATYAFTYLEKDFKGKDLEVVNQINADYIVIKKEDSVTLIPKKELINHEKEAKQALIQYKKDLINKFGKEKVSYWLHMIGIDFERIHSLTPELIYRINILSCNTEVQDLHSLLIKMQLAEKELSKSGVTGNIEDALRAMTFLSEKEVESILKFVNLDSTETVTHRDLISALKEIDITNNFHHQLIAIKTLLYASFDNPNTNDESLEAFLKKDPYFSLLLKKEDSNQILTLLKHFHTNTTELMVKDFIPAMQGLLKMRNEMQGLTKQEKTKRIGKLDITIEEFLQKTEEFDSQINHTQFAKLIQATNPTDEERELAYTGKKITRPISSSYTLADKTFYKPWIEQQELLQTYEHLESDQMQDPYTGEHRLLTQTEKLRRFDEIASHIICKKHLFHQHPHEGYRIGALIPGPSSETGEKQYYKVVKVMASNDGIMNYQLEPVGKGNQLQSYLSARSTASSNYAFQGGATIINDLNPLDTPGYLGRKSIEKTMFHITKDHTVPDWVIYQHSANQELKKTNANQEIIKNRLTTSIELLGKEFERKNSPKSMHEIVRDYNSEILLIGTKGAKKNVFLKKFNPFFKTERKRFETLAIHHSHDYSKLNIENETAKERAIRLKKEKKDANFLLKYIQKHGKTHEGHLDPRLTGLQTALKNIVNPDNISKSKPPRIVKEAFQVLEKKDLSLGDLKVIENKLRKYAEQIGEDVASKKTNGLRLAGHSLGGSIAQVETYKMLAGSNRLPVPNSHINAALYDDPGLNQEDNEHMYAHMARHHHVMKENNINIQVYHSHEVGDNVPIGGSAHLGGYTPAIQKILLREIKKQLDSSPKHFENIKSELVIKFCKNKQKKLSNKEIRKLNTLRNKPSLSSQERKKMLELHILSGFRFLTKEDLLKGLPKELIDIYTSNYQVNTELKSGTKHALELHFNMRHATRFETSKIEQSDKLSQIEREIKNINKLKMSLNLAYLIATSSEKEEIKNHPSMRLFEKQMEELSKARSAAQTYVLKNTSILSKREKRILSKKVARDAKNIAKIEKLIRKNKNLMAQIAKEYSHNLQRERKDYLGGVKVQYLSREDLGSLPGKGYAKRSKVRKQWGLGLYDRKRVKKLIETTGISILPTFFKELYSDQIKKENLQLKGHGKAINYWNPVTHALIIDANTGPKMD